MKRLFTLITMVCALFACQKAMATSVTFYAKATIQVAEECTGQGTVYFDDTEGKMEKEGTGNAMDTGDGVEGQYVSFQINVVPAEGYELDKIVDQDGKEYEYGNSYISAYSTSQDAANPAIFNLKVYFKEKSATSMDYTKTIDPKKYATLVLPVNAKITNLGAYKITGVENKAVEIEYIGDDEIPANTPVLLENNSISTGIVNANFEADQVAEACTASNGLLKGVYVNGAIPASNAEYTNYVLQEQNGVVGFYRVESEMTATDFCAYLQVPASQANATKAYFLSDEATAINAITTGKAEIYDLNGRRLNKLQKGINIVNGVKIIVK